MKSKTFLFVFSILFMVQCTTEVEKQQKPALAVVDPVEEDYFGVSISDPYRYMEDLEDPAVQNWIKAQADYSRSVLNSIPGRQRLIDNMRDFDSRISSSISNLSITDDNRYFYLKTTKPNTWKDLIACTEYLISEEYTSPKKVAIYSASAGGILVGRAMTERPDLYAAVIPGVGCMNTLRGENSPNGPVNIPEFGTSQDSVECMALIEMDSYLHLQDGVEYPATLVTAGMNDPRVIAWQPAKFAARLQAANASGKPILFWADYDAGHGMGNTKSKQFESLADVMSFALWQTGHPGFKVN